MKMAILIFNKIIAAWIRFVFFVSFVDKSETPAIYNKQIERTHGHHTRIQF
jgi:hypothetical protein